MFSLTLSQLFPHYIFPQGSDCTIKGLCLDSRYIQPHDLFFAYRGAHLDGAKFIEDAILCGASAIVRETDHPALTASLIGNTPCIELSDVAQKISELASMFYQYPGKKLKIVGITGTNGKTSCAHFIAAALSKLHMRCGIIGTLGIGEYGDVQAGSLTTPDAITLQKTFADFVQAGVKAVAMEVSSHSIAQGRVKAVPFDIAVFTNLTRDHLDYHGDMATYAAVKKRLFTETSLSYAIINADDPIGEEWLESELSAKQVIAYSVEHSDAVNVYAKDIRFVSAGLKATIVSPWGTGELTSSLVGKFNLSNLLAAFSVLCAYGYDSQSVLTVLGQLTAVPGRMQRFGDVTTPVVIVDFAHTPDALLKVLSAVKEYCEGEVYCLFGCGGDRDAGKRPMMASIAEQYADHIVVTNDNPRHEKPEAIVTDILQGFTHSSEVIVEYDRAKAIRDIIKRATVGDCVVIAGKGAETYQQIQDIKIPFSDSEVVQQALGERQC